MTRMPSKTGRSHVRWIVCLLVFLATAIIYSDRQFLSLLKPTLAAQIRWTDTQFGLVSSCFLGAYAVGLLFFGWYIDRVGVKIGYATSVFLWAIAALSHTFAASVGGFLCARTCLGLSEAGNFPAAVKAIAQWFPNTERAFATALFNSGANVGAIGAPAFIAWLLLHHTWHAAFIFIGIAGMAWVVAWWWFYSPPRENRFVSPAELAWIESDRTMSKTEYTVKVPWSHLLKFKQTWSFVVAKLITDPAWFFLLIWLPDYFKKTRGLDLKTSWLQLLTIYFIITILSLFGGWITGHLAKIGWSVTRARKTGMFIFALLVLPILAVGKVGVWPAVILIGVAGAAHQAWSANLYTTVSDMFPPSVVGSITGLGSMAGAIGSMMFIYLCGNLLDLFGPEHAAQAYFALFCYAGIAYLVAFALQHLLAPKFDPVLLLDVQPDASRSKQRC